MFSANQGVIPRENNSDFPLSRDRKQLLHLLNHSQRYLKTYHHLNTLPNNTFSEQLTQSLNLAVEKGRGGRGKSEQKHTRGNKAVPERVGNEERFETESKSIEY